MTHLKIQSGLQKPKMTATKLGQVTLPSKLLTFLMTQRTKVFQQVKIHKNDNFKINRTYFQRVMALAKTCVKGQKSVYFFKYNA